MSLLSILGERTAATPPGERPCATGVDRLKYQQTNRPSSAASLDEAMTVKLLYKPPEGRTSKLTTTAVRNTTETTRELGFASAVA